MTREVKYYRGKYYKGSLTTEQADNIYNLLQYDVVSSLRHCVFELTDAQMTEVDVFTDMWYEKYGNLDGCDNYLKREDKPIGTLTDEQTIGVAMMYYAKSMLLGDSTGLGKTVEVAALHNLVNSEYAKMDKPFRMLFLTEITSVSQIRGKIEKFTGKYVYGLRDGTQKEVSTFIKKMGDNRSISVVGSHSLLGSSAFLLYCKQHPFDMVVVDESSSFKNKMVNTYDNLKALMGTADRRICLNATPLEINLMDVYNQLNLIDPEMLPSITEFKRTFCKTKPGLFGQSEIVGYKNESAFREAISLRYLARNRADIGAEFENNNYLVVLCKMSKEQNMLMRKSSLHQLTYDAPSEVDRHIPFNAKTTPKLGALCELVQQLDIDFGKCLIYCRYVKPMDTIAESLRELGYNVVILNGKNKPTERDDIVRRFNEGEYDIMITDIKRGIDTKNCDNCIFYSIDPNPQAMVQFEGRVTREVDVRNKSVYLLIMDGSEAKFVMDKVKGRADASDSLTNSSTSLVLEALKGDRIAYYDSENGLM